jgi:hypothetical protein
VQLVCFDIEFLGHKSKHVNKPHQELMPWENKLDTTISSLEQLYVRPQWSLYTGFCMLHKTIIERTNTYIVKQYFSFNWLSYKTCILVATSVPIVQPPGWSLLGGHLKGTQCPEGGKEGTATQRPTQQTTLLLFTQETRAPSLYLETVWLNWQPELWATFCRVPSVCAKVLFIVA